MRNYGKIRVHREGNVEVLTLAVPERRNAIGTQMANELLYALDDAMTDGDVRVVVLTGEGKTFCSGGDFAQMTAGAADDALPPKGDFADLLVALVRAPKPVVAKLNGPALGGGLGLAAACTFAVATSEATVGTPEINVGLFPMMIMAVLVRLVPRRRLLDMMLLGEKMSADDAKSAGLLSHVVSPAELDSAVATLSAKLASKSPSTLRLGLRALHDQESLPLEEALPLLRERLAACLGTDDAREGLMAFLEKRPPVWTGK